MPTLNRREWKKKCGIDIIDAYFGKTFGYIALEVRNRVHLSRSKQQKTLKFEKEHKQFCKEKFFLIFLNKTIE